MDWTEEQQERYSRQILLPEIGVEGQEKLSRAKVLIVGLGGLGSPAALYLAAAGIGALGLADFDRVDLSNLQRQILHNQKDLGKAKTRSALEKLQPTHPDTQFQRTVRSARVYRFRLRLPARQVFQIAQSPPRH